MSNQEFLINYQNRYESLKYFTINNNTLILKDKGIFMQDISHTNLASLNPNLFLLSPVEIYQIIYMLELLYKNNLSEYEINFANTYINNYLTLNDKVLDGSSDDEKANILGIPIYTAYDPMFINQPLSKIIQTTLNNHTNDLESGKSNGQKLVRINPQFGSYNEENDLDYFKNAGFTAMILITITTILTVLFVFFFIFQNH